ncbi:emp24/gp25L/p24 family/GOLD-domain-containing protein [Russula earlei]|uniref:Emp24/gp25L/p24 family/GOLD-domain-containing protein n=1 Tax=Russula earlei TaxID=71964 RepID=A0ACC0TSL9_9AGAM|nr:emp24/gp25L/p24 family/GOLD-domain-containing protein [Russula earlei]
MVSIRTILPLLGLATTVYSTALTTLLTPNERLCFYADVDKAGEKIGFYFAVQSGGSFDVLLDGQRERQGDYVLTANTVGEYSFCFENDMSTLTDKLVDFDILIESEPRREAPAKPGQLQEQTDELQESIYRLNSLLMNIKRTQRIVRLPSLPFRLPILIPDLTYSFHTRENRGFSIVKSTQNRLFWYAVFETLAVITMAMLQVYALQTFFTKTARRYRYRVTCFQHTSM